LQPTITAILLDPEARADDNGGNDLTLDGHLQEPALFIVGMVRAFGGQMSTQNYYPYDLVNLGHTPRQNHEGFEGQRQIRLASAADRVQSRNHFNALASHDDISGPAIRGLLRQLPPPLPLSISEHCFGAGLLGGTVE
jgi:hypothetical protein